jgi:hypothetical protein
MTLTTRDLDILRAERRYFYLRAAQIRDLIIPHDRDGSITRGRLRLLGREGYALSYPPKLIDPMNPATAAPVWVPTVKGASVLAAMTGDCSQLLTVQPGFRDWMSVNHFCALSAVHILLDRAIAAQDRVRLPSLCFEHEEVRPDAADPSVRFRLHTNVGDGKKCCPDSAFELVVGGHRRAWYVEYETGSDNPGRVGAKKSPGYSELARKQLWTRHFPETRDFRVLCFCPNAGWRDALRREMKGKPGAELWAFIATPELRAETFLHGPLLWTVDRGPLPLVPPAPALAAPAQAPGGVSGGG